MITRTNLLFTGITFMLVAALAILIVSLPVRANPSQVYRNNPSTATTTVTYMTPGAATTTNAFNTQSDGGYIPDTSVFTECLTASSTATVLTTAFEYSFDGVTYFHDNTSTSSTAGPVVAVVPSKTYQWTFASTSFNGAKVTANNNYDCKMLTIQTPVQYVRAVMSVTGDNGAVWSDFGAKRQMR